MFLCVSCSDIKPSISVTEAEDSITSIINSDNAAGNQEEPTAEEAAVSPDAPIAEVSQETSREAVDEALQLYLEYIETLRNGNYLDDSLSAMSLVFIDDDDVPELVIDRSYPHNGGVICTVSNGAVNAILAEGGGDGINYIERGNRFAYTAIKQDIYYDTICCIENGMFVILHEGFRNVSEDQWYWDGEAISFSEYSTLQREAFDYSGFEYTGTESIRTVDMIYEINLQLSDSLSSATVDARDSITGLLTSDGAFAVYDSWQTNHPNAPLVSRQSRIDGYNGEQYYLFPAKYTYMYYYNILVHMESGELLYMLTTDGMDPYTLIEPLDNWYNKAYKSLDATQILDIIDYYGPPVTEEGDFIGIKGTVVSNCQILSVSVTVLKDREEVETSSSANPYTNVYDINQLEYDLHLDTLTPGGKIYVIEATDETGTITLISLFWVN